MELFKKHPHMKIVAERVKEHEGFKLKPYYLKYTDATGKEINEDFLTGGYGRKMKKGEVAPVTKEGWEALFQQDFNKAFNSAKKLIDINNIDPIAMGIVTEMVYQMGAEGVSKFDKTLKYINKRQYKEASKEMMDSKWAIQTKDRAVMLSNLMSSISDN